MNTSITAGVVAEADPNPCFEDSRRLTGHNWFFAGPGVVLTPLGTMARDRAAHTRWQEWAALLFQALGWGDFHPVIRPHASGVLLAFSAPADFLFTATEVNEWAWEQASGIFASAADGGDPANAGFDQLHPLGNVFSAVVAAFVARREAERNPALIAIREEAARRDVPLYADDNEISLGAGAGSRTWPLVALPPLSGIPWDALSAVPVALVTGSNGKTTTVRLLTALIAASGEKYQGHVGYCSTEGIVIGGEPVAGGDYSGPAGARMVLRDPRVKAAVLESARGGLLRRGLAVDRADVAIVTNISADHFGEYGIDTLDDLAGVKLSVARALGKTGTLVLNADDRLLLARAAAQVCPLALFAQDDADAVLNTHRRAGGTTCGVADGQMWLTHRGARYSLGAIADMPLTLNGAARYNVANIAAAALGAHALGISPPVIANVLATFGSKRADNPGRLTRWALADVTVLMDYAHNPDGLARLMAVAKSLQRRGRIGLLLGQAGNRADDAIQVLARTAAEANPDVIVIKEIASMLRGRVPGEVSTLLRSTLLAGGVAPSVIEMDADEIDACRRLLRWAHEGDVLVMPVHQGASRNAMMALLDEMERVRWQSGTALPPL